VVVLQPWQYAGQAIRRVKIKNNDVSSPQKLFLKVDGFMHKISIFNFRKRVVRIAGKSGFERRASSRL
jgi:hypothetical protein